MQQIWNKWKDKCKFEAGHNKLISIFREFWQMTASHCEHCLLVFRGEYQRFSKTLGKESQRFLRDSIITYNNFKYSSPWRESNKAELFIGDYGDKIFTVPIKAIMCQFLNYWTILFVISKGILLAKKEHTNMALLWDSQHVWSESI